MAQEKKGPVAQLKEQLDEKSKSCNDLQQEYLRALADFENIRKRFERDIEVSRRLTLEALVLDLIPVLDNFERAVQVTGTGATAEGLQRGMDLIHRQLLEALGKHGLQEYSCVGTQFDPRRAEAISFVHTDEHKPGTVVSEICKGYASGERVLRPARVVVAKEPERTAGQGPLGPSQKSEGRSQNAEVGAGGSLKPEAKGQKAGTGEIEESDSESNG
jgi:molecular chaperone GrpE